MVNKNLIPIFFTFSFIIIVIATLLKILHQPFSVEIMALGLISAVFYIILSLIEIFKSDRIGITEKIMWLVAFTAMGTVTGLVYIVSGRRRVLRDFKLNI